MTTKPIIDAPRHYTRMTIGECLSDTQVQEFSKITEEHIRELGTAKGFVSARVLTEEGGRMVILETTWLDRGTCIDYHSSRAYRQFVTATQHLLIGGFVVKLFHSAPAVVNIQDAMWNSIIQEGERA